MCSNKEERFINIVIYVYTHIYKEREREKRIDRNFKILVFEDNCWSGEREKKAKFPQTGEKKLKLFK